MAEPLTQLNQLMQFIKASDKNAQLRDKYPAGEELIKLQALDLFRQRLMALQEYKKKYPKDTNTGPYISKYWKVGPQFDEKGDAIPTGHLQNLVKKIKGEEASRRRAVFEGMLSDVNERAIDLGGKTTTGVEKKITIGDVPTMFVDDAEFDAMNERNLNEAIPMEIQRRVKTLIDMGYPKETIINMFQKR